MEPATRQSRQWLRQPGWEYSERGFAGATPGGRDRVVILKKPAQAEQSGRIGRQAPVDEWV